MIPETHYDSTAAKTIQHLIDTFGYTSYLELGVRGNTTFNQIKCERKVGVDKNAGGTFRMSTDEYFAQCVDKFDIIFVDAGHVHDQVMRDVRNSLKILNKNGTIVMHDCFPYTRDHESVEGKASGTVWRAYVHLRMDPNLDMICSNYDHGVSLVRQGTNETPLTNIPHMNELTYDVLLANMHWLDMRSWNEVQAWIIAKNSTADQ